MANKITCVVVDDEPMAREIVKSYIEKTPQLELKKICKDAAEAIEFHQEHEVDLFFLDIQMPEINGVSLAKILKKKAQVIFTTAYRDYAIEGFELQVADYLLKPFSFDGFLEAVTKVRPLVNSIEKDFVFVRSDRKMVKVDYDKINYIESLSDYLKIHLEGQTVVTRENISNLEEILPAKSFIRTHRSFIIAIQKITSYTNEYIELGNISIPISRSYKESVLQKLAEM